MKIFCFLFFVFCIASCGTIGHIQFYNFTGSKYVVEQELRFIISEDSIHSIPAKWADVYSEPGPIELIFVYFANSPEEMYQIGFTGDSTTWKIAQNCKLSLDGVFKGDHWEFQNELNFDEMQRIKKRFENEILKKLTFSYYKSN